jgi:hypothetical protein
MVRVAPAEPRLTIYEELDGLVITIPVQRRWAFLLFVSAWLCGWTVGGIFAAGMFVLGGAALVGGNWVPAAPVAMPLGMLLFLGAWLVGWAVGEASALRGFFWNLAGREIVAINPDVLSIRHEIFGMGRSWEYDASQVCYLRCSASVYNPSNPSFREGMPGMNGPGIAFDYGARTYGFGIGLDDAETNLVVTEILERFPALGPPTAAPSPRSP